MAFKSKRITFEELSEVLREYERKYGCSTIEFFRRFQSGNLGDDDDLMMWSGLVHLALVKGDLHLCRKRTAMRRLSHNWSHHHETA